MLPSGHNERVTRRWGASAGAAASAVLAGLVLSGCVAAPQEPRPPSKDEVDSYVARMLDLTWQNTGLGTSYYLPQGDPKPLAAPEEFITAVTECYSEQGLGELNMSSSAENGYMILESDGEQSLDPMKQITLFHCLRLNPADPVASGELVSADQLAYLYDRYLTWTIPCVRSAGYRIDDLPSRAVFVATSPQSWYPYSQLGGLDLARYDALVARCGNDWIEF